MALVQSDVGQSWIVMFQHSEVGRNIKPRRGEAMQNGSASGSARTQLRNLQVSKHRELVEHRHLRTTHLLPSRLLAMRARLPVLHHHSLAVADVLGCDRYAMPARVNGPR
jgi:hypothetical protein